jgi:hypothetical protein
MRTICKRALRMLGTVRRRTPPSGPMKMWTCSSARRRCSPASTSTTKSRRRSSRPRSNCRVQGVIGGVAVRGFVDLLDTSGRVIDPKTAARKPTGVSAVYAFQVATPPALPGGDSRKAREDTLVATKSLQVVTQEYTVSQPDLKFTEKLYPLVREGDA